MSVVAHCVYPQEADLVLLVGTNPRFEAPLVNARIRKRWRVQLRCFILNCSSRAQKLSYLLKFIRGRVQWNPSNPDALGAIPSVLFSGVSSFQGLNNTEMCYDCPEVRGVARKFKREFPSLYFYIECTVMTRQQCATRVTYNDAAAAVQEADREPVLTAPSAI